MNVLNVKEKETVRNNDAAILKKMFECRVTCGTTWHSVGLVSTMKATRTDMAMTRYSADLYKQWEAEGEGVGQSNITIFSIIIAL